MTSDEAWARLGTAVRSRRELLGLSVRECTEGRRISDTTWGKLEAGRYVSTPMLAAVASAIRWTLDSPLRVLEGDDPIEIDNDGRDHEPEIPLRTWLNYRLTAIEESVEDVARQVAELREERQAEAPPA